MLLGRYINQYKKIISSDYANLVYINTTNLIWQKRLISRFGIDFTRTTKINYSFSFLEINFNKAINKKQA